MKKTLSILALITLFGCTSKSEPGTPVSAPIISTSPVTAEEIKVEIVGWLGAYARAEATKTHASGEHPAAQAEMDRHELALGDMKKKDLPLVKKVVNGLHNQFHQEKEAVIQKRNQIQVVGRTLTPEEKKFVEVTAPMQLQEISERDNAFHAFMKFIQK